jgi:hypothetical protein
MVGQVAQGLRAAGQAQQHDADVLRHRQQHLAQHLGLRLDALRALALPVTSCRPFRRRRPSTSSATGAPNSAVSFSVASSR